MANQIRLKRGSGSDPSASDLATGEIAVRTDNGKLFTKKDDGSVAEISGGGGVPDGDKGDITVSNDGATFTIDNDAVTYAKIQNVSATDRILGRDSSGAGVIEEITPANLRTMINVEDGATADQTAAEIKTLLNSNQLETAQIANNAITADKISNSTVTFSKLQNVSQNRIVGRVSSGSGVLQELTAANIRSIINVEDGATGDQTASDIRSLGFFDTNNDGAGSGLDSDLLDGFHGSQYLRSDANDTADGTIGFNGGAGAATIAGDSDIRFNNGAWTGNSCKIQHHSNYLYIQSGSSGHVFRHSSGDNRWLIDDNGHFVPGTDSTFNIGTNGNRVANGYFDTLYGDGSNITGVSASDNTKLPLSGGELTGDLITHEVRPDGNNTRSLGTSSARWSEIYTNDLHLSNKGSSNSVDGTWGDWTIQEGEEKIFILNNRNGKKYAINLTEIV